GAARGGRIASRAPGVHRAVRAGNPTPAGERLNQTKGGMTMMKKSKLRAALLACAVVPYLAGTAGAQPVVKTTFGPVTGVEQNGQMAWLGIPYAAAPTGERRWRAPAAPQTWTEAHTAAAFGASCPQAVMPQ